MVHFRFVKNKDLFTFDWLFRQNYKPLVVFCKRMGIDQAAAETFLDNALYAYPVILPEKSLVESLQQMLIKRIDGQYTK